MNSPFLFSISLLKVVVVFPSDFLYTYYVNIKIVGAYCIRPQKTKERKIINDNK